MPALYGQCHQCITQAVAYLLSQLPKISPLLLSRKELRLVPSGVYTAIMGGRGSNIDPFAVNTKTSSRVLDRRNLPQSA